MFCGKCGANVPDGAKFCDVCGQPMAPAAPETPMVETPAVEAPVAPVVEAPAAAAPKKSKKGLIIAIIAVVAALAVGVGCFFLLGGGGSSFEGLVDNYANLGLKGEADDLRSMAPEVFWVAFEVDYNITPEQIATDSQWMTNIQKQIAETNEENAERYGADWTCDFSVVCDHEVTSEQLQNIRENLKEYYDISSYSVSEARILHIKVVNSGSLKTETSIQRMYATNIDGEWYLMSNTGSFAASLLYNVAPSRYSDYDSDYYY